MIRINLLGQIRPKAARRPVDTGVTVRVVELRRATLIVEPAPGR